MESERFDAAHYLTDARSRLVYLWEGIKDGSLIESIKTVIRSLGK